MFISHFVVIHYFKIRVKKPIGAQVCVVYVDWSLVWLESEEIDHSLFSVNNK